MSMNPLSVGIIGAGAFAVVHATALKKHPDAKLTAILDTDIARGKKFAQDFGCSFCTSLKDLLKKNTAVVTIVTPNETHARFIEEISQAANRPQLMIVEKPLCVSEDELTRIQPMLEKTGQRIVVDHSRRFNAGFERLATMIAAGELGTLLAVRFRYYAGWFHVGVHVVDTLQMLLGDLSVASARRTGPGRYPKDFLADVALRSARFPDAIITLEGVPEEYYRVFEAELNFDGGRIRIQWGDIFIDRLKPMPPHSPLLAFAEQYAADDTTTALKRMYTLAARSVRNEDNLIMKIAGLTQARGIMDILFDVSRRIR